MNMLKRQVAITPPPQWVRVVGGFTAHQFAEKRLPTLDELNMVAPETPVFLLHLYDRALLNRAAVRAAGYTKETPEPPGGSIERDSVGVHIVRGTCPRPETTFRLSIKLDTSFYART
jgi:predicted amidohydrolase YtcJ